MGIITEEMKDAAVVVKVTEVYNLEPQFKK